MRFIHRFHKNKDHNPYLSSLKMSLPIRDVSIKLLSNEVNASKKLPMKRVCGLDMHKDSVFVCIMDESGVIFRETFGVLTCDLENMAKKFSEHYVMEVAMESTSVYFILDSCMADIGAALFS